METLNITREEMLDFLENRRENLELSIEMNGGYNCDKDEAKLSQVMIQIEDIESARPCESDTDKIFTLDIVL